MSLIRIGDRVIGLDWLIEIEPPAPPSPRTIWLAPGRAVELTPTEERDLDALLAAILPGRPWRAGGHATPRDPVTGLPIAP